MHGFLLIDKAAGMSSFDVVRALRRITGIRRIGHCGTLDPFATGLLICALGSYTRLLSFLESQSKSYEATLRMGQSTSTGDPECEIESSMPVEPQSFDPQKIRAEALMLKELPIPKYSAVKVDGQRAYKLARQGQELNLAHRAVQIHSFDFIDASTFKLENPYISYRCTVSKGTYIRSLSIWIASQMQNVAFTQSLRRTAIGDISVDESKKLNELEPWRDALVDESRLFAHLPQIHLDTKQLSILKKGQNLADPLADAEHVLVFDAAGSIQSLAYRKDGRLYPKVNFS